MNGEWRAGVVTTVVVSAGVIVSALLPGSRLEAQQGASGFDATYGCVVCHSDKRRAFVQGVHSERGIRCHDCHGGNPQATERPAAHQGRFVGSPNKIQIVQLCASCHSDANQMRQYGLASDQLAEFRTSRHGQLLLGQRNFDAPTCTDCHDAHMILRPEDARSGVHPTNIPATCARCHGDERLMAKYGIPTNQGELYRRGAHGIAVLDKHNFSAPTCVGCHGSHGALPPQVTEIAHVCARCHVLLGSVFYAGPHGTPARTGKLPGCLGCHSNHGTERVPPERIAEGCLKCHPTGSAPAQRGADIEADVVRATEEIHAAREAIQELVRQGRPVRDARFRYQVGFTAYKQIAQVQHGLDLISLDDLARSVASTSREIRGIAEVRAEQRWEHKLLLVPVWFLALAALVLAAFKRADLRRRGS